MATSSKGGGKGTSGSASQKRSRTARKAAGSRRRASERLRATARKAAASRERRRTRRGGGRGTSATRTASGGMSQAKRDSLDAQQYAFPKQRKEPLNDAKHVRNAIARFDQVEGVSDKQRDKAWRRIMKAAKRYNVEMSVKSWRKLGKKSKQG